MIDGDGADPFNGFVWLAARTFIRGFIVTAAPLEGRERRVHDLMDYVGSGEYEEVDGLIRKVNADLKHRSKRRHRIKFVSVNRYVEESYDLGLILGWYVAEGHISKRSGKDGREDAQWHPLHDRCARTRVPAGVGGSVRASLRRRSRRASKCVGPVGANGVQQQGGGFALPVNGWHGIPPEALVPRGTDSRRRIPAWLWPGCSAGMDARPPAGWCSTW